MLVYIVLLTGRPKKNQTQLEIKKYVCIALVELKSNAHFPVQQILFRVNICI